MDEYIVPHEKSGTRKLMINQILFGMAAVGFSNFFFEVIGGYIGAGGGGACIGLGAMFIIQGIISFIRSGSIESIATPLIQANTNGITFTLPHGDFSASATKENATIPFSNISNISGSKKALAQRILLNLKDADSFYNSLTTKSKRQQLSLAKQTKTDAVISLETTTQEVDEILKNLQAFL